jgi:hypothetical protein
MRILFGAIGLMLITSTLVAQPLAWETYFPRRDAYLWEAVYANGRFVAVGYAGAIATSRYGKVWTLHDPGTNGSFSAITYGNGLYVAGGDDSEDEGPNLLITSPDARNWTVRELPPAGKVYALAYGAGKFVAITFRQSRVSTVFTSTDGMSWAPTAVWSNVFVRKLIFAAGMFVGAGVDYSGVSIAPAIVTSADGSDWTQQEIPTFWGYLSGLTYGSGQFIAVGWPGAVLRSADGTNWLHQALGTNVLGSVAYGGGLFVAVGYRDSNPTVGFYRYSRDGQHWFGGSFGSSRYFSSSITYGGGSFIVLQAYQGLMDKPKTRVLRGTPVNLREQNRTRSIQSHPMWPFVRP